MGWDARNAHLLTFYFIFHFVVSTEKKIKRRQKCIYIYVFGSVAVANILYVFGSEAAEKSILSTHSYNNADKCKCYIFLPLHENFSFSVDSKEWTKKNKFNKTFRYGLISWPFILYIQQRSNLFGHVCVHSDTSFPLFSISLCGILRNCICSRIPFAIFGTSHIKYFYFTTLHIIHWTCQFFSLVVEW